MSCNVNTLVERERERKIVETHLDTVSCGDDPAFGDDGRPALVFELARLVLPQRHLPGPLSVAGHTPTNDSSAPSIEELPAADLGVVRARVESVEGSGATFGTDGVVLQRNIDLRRVLTDVISSNIRPVSQSVSQSGSYPRPTSRSHSRRH